MVVEDSSATLLALESSVATSGSLFGDALRERLPSAGPIVASKFDLQAWLRALDAEVSAASSSSSTYGAAKASATPTASTSTTTATLVEAPVAPTSQAPQPPHDNSLAPHPRGRICFRCGGDPCDCNARKRQRSGYRNQAWKRFRTTTVAQLGSSASAPVAQHVQVIPHLLSDELEPAYAAAFRDRVANRSRLGTPSLLGRTGGLRHYTATKRLSK